jgi:hypothetical protein
VEATPTCRKKHGISAARADDKLARQFFAYEMLAERRNQQDSMLWQAHAWALTAQAFLVTIALGGGGVSVLSRALASGLDLVVAYVNATLWRSIGASPRTGIADRQKLMQRLSKRRYSSSLTAS